ncbi:MAG: transglycosylase SLT domain-containing protein [Proteobacteria bacterium]|nr:transglycosylase SLT domain-containing protein [Pseudomonadota bacterium]
MRRTIRMKGPSVRQVRRYLRIGVSVALLGVLGACGGTTAKHGRYSPTRYYPPPGPPSDPWGPYIREASARFDVPEQWIRRVMRQESGGQEDVVSWAGAMGLMQVMPDTYTELRARYGLGDDPFDPHNNVLAGTAYLKEMYNRYGAPGFLAAYNAGPRRLDRYLNNGTPLPEETVQYVAAIAPNLGPGTVMSGPLAVYAGGGTRYAAVARRSRAGCDPDAAYDPARPCGSSGRAAVAAATPRFTPGPPASSTGCDPDAAYDPTQPCRPAAVRVAAVAAPAPFVPGPPASATGCDPDTAYDPTRPCRPAPVQVATIAPAPFVPGPPASATGCDPDAAYDPGQRCRPAPVIAAAAPVSAEPLAPPPSAQPQPFPSQSAPPPRSGYLQAAAPLPGGGRRPMQEGMTQPATYAPPTMSAPPPAQGGWGIQVGAFATLPTAEAAALSARAAAPDLLRMTKIELPPTTPLGSQVAFRARLTGLTQAAATDACARLSARGTACLTLPPQRPAF